MNTTDGSCWEGEHFWRGSTNPEVKSGKATFQVTSNGGNYVDSCDVYLNSFDEFISICNLLEAAQKKAFLEAKETIRREFGKVISELKPL